MSPVDQTDSSALETMIVDLMADERRAIAARLRSIGFGPIIHMDTGQEALDFLAHSSVGTVIFPKELSSPGAVRFARRVKRLQDLSLLVVCDGIDAQELLQLIESGVDECIKRPCQSEALRDKMTRLLHATV